MKPKKFIVLALLILGLYLVVRLGWKESIEFGYDQPILASSVLDFIKNPTFMGSYRFVNVNPWGYPSWGPMQIFFYAPFLLTSQHPITVSQLIAVFNLISIAAVIYLGYKYFSPLVGIVAGLILALHPWWVIFSRMIYQPTPVPTFIAVSILLTFVVRKKPSSIYLTLLLFSWGLLIQFYVHTISFVLVSFIYLLTDFKKLSKKYFILGVLVNLGLFLPVIYHYFTGSEEFLGFLKVVDQFGSKNEFSLPAVLTNFVLVMAGGAFKWQLGYAYQDFVQNFTLINYGSVTALALLIIVFGYNIAKIFLNKKTRALRLLLLAWIMGPLGFLILIKTPVALPRYFLQSLVPLSILVGITFQELIPSFRRVFWKPFLAVIFLGLGFVLCYWSLLTVNYFNFVINYSYPNGFLSSFSDVPYHFLDQSMRWIVSDARRMGYGRITISNDPENPSSDFLGHAALYTKRYLYQKEFSYGQNSKTGHYLLYFSSFEGKDQPMGYARFGPYVVYEVRE